MGFITKLELVLERESHVAWVLQRDFDPLLLMFGI